MKAAAEWCDHLLGRLAFAVARECPEGLGHWEPAWEIVTAASDALLAELEEIKAGRGDQERAKRLGLDVLEAWRRAAAEWRAEVDVAA